MEAALGLAVIWVVACIAVAMIAGARGRSGMAIFWLSFFLSPLIGLIVALASKSAQQIAREEGSYGEYKKCPFCAESIRAEAVKCKHCGSALVEPKVEAREDYFESLAAKRQAGKQ